jgi:NTP pyrophosphatase (non-canonical NTP hydrolase)
MSNPKHYAGGWSVDNFIDKHNLNFRLGNVVKYLSRAGKKDGNSYLQDLYKAKDYLEREIYLEERIEQIKKNMNLTDEFNPIIEWAEKRGILDATVDRQFIKLQEEVGELAVGILKKDEKAVYDAIGDCVVVLTILAKIRGTTIEQCINGAYNTIKAREGKMVNGVFVKEVGNAV